MSKKLADKVALVTGGSAGIGLASAKALAEQGAKVYITGRRQEELDAAVRFIGPAARGIRINVVSPGPVRTPGLGGLVAEADRQGLFDALAAGVPLGRLGEPEEIGRTVVFLASDESSFINAAEIYVDGGLAQI